MTPLVVMTKYPTPGHVKTRLAAEIGPERAAALYRAFLQDLAERLESIGCEIETWWAVWPPWAPFDDLLGDARTFPQEAGDLGARMVAACERVRPRPGGAVIVIGADMPHLPLARIHEARAALAGGADVVVGPAEDGGYYLIGTRKPVPWLFTDIPWGTREVLAATKARVRAAGLGLTELPCGWDVDDAPGLERLKRLVGERPRMLPRTAALLGEA